jgi:4-hydroxy-2-oxoheptanedioate aldolase
MPEISHVFAERLGSGAPSYAAWCSQTEPLALDALLREGFDCAVIDMQHGGNDFASVINGITMVAAHGKPAIVRIPVGAFQTASRVLDAGATGVIAPMVNSAEDARQLAAFTKFPPLGERSWGPFTAMPRTGLTPPRYLAEANVIHVTIAMIETKAAMAALDDILAVDGIDGVFVGPNDLCIALTDGAAVDAAHPLVDKALDHVAARARAAGKFASAFCMDGKRAGEVVAKGFQLVSVANDTLLLRMAARSELAIARKAASSAPAGSY